MLQLYVNGNTDPSPIAYYAMCYFAAKAGDDQAAKNFAQKAYNCKSDYCFPNKLEEIKVLQYAITADPKDDKAFYYLGNLWFGLRQYAEALNAFEKSIAINPSFPTAPRNLSLLYFNKEQQPGKALRALEIAFSLDKTDARVLMELDQLYKKLNTPHKNRLTLLEEHQSLIDDRDDLYLERVALYNLLGDHHTAKKILANRIFHPWEGGEGKVVSQFLIAHIELAKIAIADSRYNDAIALLDATADYPHNLGEGKIFGTQENDINYLKGCAYEGIGNRKKATTYFEIATQGLSEPVQAIYYNDQQPDKIFYQGLAWKKLGDHAKAESIFNRLISFGKSHLDDKIRIDYFAVSLPDLLVFEQDLDLRNRNHCRYLMGLGCLGLNNGKIAEAEEHFNADLQNDINHSGALIHKKMIQTSVLTD